MRAHIKHAQDFGFLQNNMNDVFQRTTFEQVDGIADQFGLQWVQPPTPQFWDNTLPMMEARLTLLQTKLEVAERIDNKPIPEEIQWDREGFLESAAELMDKSYSKYEPDETTLSEEQIDFLNEQYQKELYDNVFSDVMEQNNRREQASEFYKEAQDVLDHLSGSDQADLRGAYQALIEQNDERAAGVLMERAQHILLEAEHASDNWKIPVLRNRANNMLEKILRNSMHFGSLQQEAFEALASLDSLDNTALLNLMRIVPHEEQEKSYKSVADQLYSYVSYSTGQDDQKYYENRNFFNKAENAFQAAKLAPHRSQIQRNFMNAFLNSMREDLDQQVAIDKEKGSIGTLHAQHPMMELNHYIKIAKRNPSLEDLIAPLQALQKEYKETLPDPNLEGLRTSLEEPQEEELPEHHSHPFNVMF